jgi:signal transduction histidine kinase
VAVLLAVGGIASALVTRAGVTRAGHRNNLVHQVVTDLLALNVLRADYQLFKSDRARVQWEAEQKRLAALLVRVHALYPMSDATIKRLQDANAARLRLFEALVANYQGEVAGKVSPQVRAQTEARLVGQLLVLAQSTIDDADTLAAESQAELTSAQNLSAWLTIIFIVLLGVVVLLLSLLVGTSVLSALKKLEQGAGAVATGDLGYRIVLDRDDEMGRVATAFNHMTGELELSTDELERHRDRLEQLVANRTEELERANEELDAYARAVSHDLRGPLAAATLANDVLKDAVRNENEVGLRDDVSEFTESIERNLARAHEMVTGLLKVAEAGQKPADVSLVSISEIVEEFIAERKATIEEAGARLEIDDDLGQVLADRTQMYQVFANLISNTLRHNDSDQPITTIKSLGDEEGFHRFTVCDNGSGIKEEDLEKIFRPFFKDSRTSDTGIGLSIVDKIVRAYGGWITAYNDNGACFEFAIRDWSND